MAENVNLRLAAPASQNIPCVMLAVLVGTNAFSLNHTYAPSNVASLEWKIVGDSPTQCSGFSTTVEPQSIVNTSGLALRALAQNILAKSRPMADWEKEDADEFFRSQFA
jgi:hypothetical protein